MMFQFIINKKAITLVETIIYLALFGVIFTSLITFVLNITESFTKASAKNEIHTNLIFIDNHIDSMIKTSQNVNESSSVLDDNNGKISLTKNSVNIEYYLSNGTLYYKEGSTTTALNTNVLIVKKFLIKKAVDRNNVITGFHIEYTFSHNKINVNENFNTFYAR